jgi:hypothetical protein
MAKRKKISLNLPSHVDSTTKKISHASNICIFPLTTHIPHNCAREDMHISDAIRWFSFLSD